MGIEIASGVWLISYGKKHPQFNRGFSLAKKVIGQGTQSFCNKDNYDIMGIEMASGCVGPICYGTTSRYPVEWPFYPAPITMAVIYKSLSTNYVIFLLSELVRIQFNS